MDDCGWYYRGLTNTVAGITGTYLTNTDQDRLISSRCHLSPTIQFQNTTKHSISEMITVGTILLTLRRSDFGIDLLPCSLYVLFCLHFGSVFCLAWWPHFGIWSLSVQFCSYFKAVFADITTFRLLFTHTTIVCIILLTFQCSLFSVDHTLVTYSSCYYSISVTRHLNPRSYNLPS